VSPPNSNGEPNNDKPRLRVLPDPAICRARLYGVGVLVDCLVDHPRECKFALSFGTVFFCQRPDRHQIAARTKALQEQQGL